MHRRAFERVDSSIQVRFSCDNSVYLGLVNDLSENGMRIRTNNCSPFKSKIEVHFPVKEGVVTFSAKVIRLIKSSDFFYAMGVELLNPPKNYLDFVNNFRWESLGKLSKKMNQGISIYTCKICGHIVFERMPTECPMCTASIENFEKKPDALRRPEYPENLSEFEKKHIPIINISKTNGFTSDNGYNIHVKVGEIEHPMKIEDHISFIDYYIEASNIKKRCLGRMILRCDKIQPSVMFYLNNLNSSNLIVISNCNAHGSWMAQAEM